MNEKKIITKTHRHATNDHKMKTFHLYDVEIKWVCWRYYDIVSRNIWFGRGLWNAHVAFEQIAVAFQHVYTWFGDLMRNQLRYWVSEMRISKLTNNLAQRTNFIAASKFTVIGCDDHLNSLCSNLPFFFNSSCYCCSYILCCICFIIVARTQKLGCAQ